MTHNRWIGRVLVALSVACSLVIAPGASREVPAQTDELSATIPLRVHVGETVELTGRVGGACQGAVEVGFWTKDPPVQNDREIQDFRDGSEVVLHRMTGAPGSTFATEIVVPDLGVQQAWLYRICRGPESWVYGMTLITLEAVQEPSTEPSEAESRPPDGGPNGVPVARPDRAQVAVGQTFTLPVPGVLGNDEDPDGDQLVAVRTGGASSVAGGLLSFRPDGSVEFVPAAEAPLEAVTGAICISYQARDPAGATSEQTTLVILAGDVGDEGAAVAAVTSDGGCRPPMVGKDAVELTLTDGPGNLPDAGVAAAPLLSLADTGTSLLAAPALEGLAGLDTLAVRIPNNVGCFRSNCLWGYFGPPHYTCNREVGGSWLNRRYGSMTAYAYLRKGLSDYVKVRPVFFQDGTRLDPQFVWRGGWTKKTFPYLTGPETYNRWVYAKLHMRFGSPGSTYLIGFEAEWYDDRPFGRDRLLAKSGPPAMVPYACVSAGGM